MNEIFKVIKPTQIYLFVTLVFALYSIKKNTFNHIIIILILSNLFITEVLSSVILFYHKSHNYIYSISIPLHHCSWLLLLYRNSSGKFFLKVATISYILFILYDFIFNNSLLKFNFYIFIVGAIIYISSFIHITTKKLKYEEFAFFTSNTYLLLYTPLIFFAGVSAVFAFSSPELAKNKIILNLTLYDVIIHFVNIIYYTLINIYIYRERKLQHA
jgi:hypothetical protein